MAKTRERARRADGEERAAKPPTGREAAPEREGDAGWLMGLQRAAGNSAVSGLLAGGGEGLPGVESASPSELPRVVSSALAAAPARRARETEALRAAVPVVSVPTGLAPAGGGPAPAAPAVPQLEVPEVAAPPSGGAGGGETGVDTSGEANPLLNELREQAASGALTRGHRAADAAANADSGVSRIAPSATSETFQPTLPALGGAEASPGPLALEEPSPKVRAALDGGAGAQLHQQVLGHSTSLAAAHERHARETDEVWADGNRKLAEENAATRGEQVALRGEAEQEVTGRQAQWRQENEQIAGEYERTVGARRAEVDGAVQANILDATRRARGLHQEAQQRAQSESGGAGAGAGRQGWMERAAGAVRGAYDKARSVVSEILEAARAAIRGVLDAARSAVIGLIQGFAGFVKDAAGVALAAMPRAAAAARAWIDARVAQARQAIEAAAAALKSRVIGLFDAVVARVAAVVSAYRAMVSSVLSAAAAAARRLVEIGGKIAAFLRMLANQAIEKVIAVVRKPELLTEAISSFAQPLLLQVPEKVEELVSRFVLTPEDNQGIKDRLGAQLQYLGANWGSLLLKSAAGLVFPPLVIAEALPGMWQDVKAGYADLKQGKLSDAVDHGLSLFNAVEGIMGSLVGTAGIVLMILSLVFGPAGFAAAAAIVETAGLAVVAATVAGLMVTVEKSVYNLSDRSLPAEARAHNYDAIASSLVGAGVTTLMVVLGALAARFGKFLASKVRGLLPSRSMPRLAAPEGAGTFEDPLRGAKVEKNLLSSAGERGTDLGAASGARRAQIPGIEGDVVVKQYPDSPGFRNKIAGEMAVGQIASDAGVGVPIHGVVELPSAKGTPAAGFAMGEAPGGFFEEFGRGRETAAGAREAAANALNITDQSFRDVQTFRDALSDRGYIALDDVQGFVGPDGRWRPIDFAEYRPAPEMTPERIREVNQAEFDKYLDKMQAAKQHAESGWFSGQDVTDLVRARAQRGPAPAAVPAPSVMDAAPARGGTVVMDAPPARGGTVVMDTASGGGRGGTVVMGPEPPPTGTVPAPAETTAVEPAPTAPAPAETTAVESPPPTPAPAEEQTTHTGPPEPAPETPRATEEPAGELRWPAEPEVEPKAAPEPAVETAAELAPAEPEPSRPDPGASSRQSSRVPGLYEGIDPSASFDGWRFEDDALSNEGGVKVRNTKVTAPDGSQGWIRRGINARGELVMLAVDLESIPKPMRWIPTDPPMVAGRGTPLEAYLTMRQMKLLALDLDLGDAFAGPRVVRMAKIDNVRACLELAAAMRDEHLTPDQAVLRTQSVGYAKNSIVQSGGEISGVRVYGADNPDRFVRVDRMPGITPELMQQFGFAPTDRVPYGFQIELEVTPTTAPAAEGTFQDPLRGAVIEPDKLSSAGFEGSGSGPDFGVRRAQVPGIEGPTVVKQYPVDYPGRPQMVENEIAVGQVAHEAGVGVPIHGVVELPPGEGGRPLVGFAMGEAPGGFFLEEDAENLAAARECALNAANISEQSFADVRTFGDAMTSHQIEIKGDFQGYLGPDGRWRPIDFQSYERGSVGPDGRWRPIDQTGYEGEPPSMTEAELKAANDQKIGAYIDQMRRAQEAVKNGRFNGYDVSDVLAGRRR